MPSPFPGMDPYLDHPAIWPGLNGLLISSSALSLGPKVAPKYYVAIEERTYLAAVDSASYLGRPDVAIVGESDRIEVSGARASTALVGEPITVDLPIPDQIKERYLEIRDTRSHSLVTVIEILSPTNKLPGEGREQYERKRRRVLGSSTNLVEIDLLRIGDVMPMNALPDTHYRILVSREWERYEAKLYRFNVSDPIPEVPIPLRPTDTEPVLNLNEILTQVYTQLRFDLRIDYSTAPDPPFRAEDNETVQTILLNRDS